MTGFLAHLERFERVASTNDVVRDWLAAGVAEVCVAVADQQDAGRGRAGRTWTAPPEAALLCSLGFRPTWLKPGEAWRLAATSTVAMAEACEATAELAGGTVQLKWPNDLVITSGDGTVRKLAGILGETEGLGTDDPRVVVGIGVNVDWAPEAFPPELASTMTSLREIAGRPVDREAVLRAFLARLEPKVNDLRGGAFDATSWADRQVTTNRWIRLERAAAVTTAFARGVDASSGALLVSEDPSASLEPVLVGDITHVRLADDAPVTV